MKRRGARDTRKSAIAIFGSLYTFESFGDRLSCAYCGDVRECIDHIPPLSVVAKYGTDAMRERGIDLMTVPSCNPCNRDLGGRPLATYEERLLFLYERLVQKIEKKEGIWSADEIDKELTGNLKRMVEAKHRIFMREVVHRLRGIEEKISSIEGLHAQ